MGTHGGFPHTHDGFRLLTWYRPAPRRLPMHGHFHPCPSTDTSGRGELWVQRQMPRRLGEDPPAPRQVPGRQTLDLAVSPVVARDPASALSATVWRTPSQTITHRRESLRGCQVSGEFPTQRQSKNTRGRMPQSGEGNNLGEWTRKSRCTARGDVTQPRGEGT